MDAQKNRIVKKNTLVLLARETLNKGTLFILLILIGRMLGKEALGRYSLALAISSIFFFGTEFGLNTLAIREIAKNKFIAGKFLVTMGALRVIMGVVTMGLIAVTSAVLGAHGETATVIYLCAFSYFLVNITSLYTSVFRAFEKMEFELGIAVIKIVIFLPAALWILKSGGGLIPIFIIFFIANVISFIVAHLIFLDKIAQPLWIFDLNFCRKQLAHTSWVWLSQLFGIAYLKIAPLLLFRMKGEGAVGVYNAAFVVVDGFWMMGGCFIAAIFPVISRLHEISVQRVSREYLNGLRFICICLVPIGIVLVLTCSSFLPVIYGQKFTGVAPVFTLLTGAALLIVLDGLSGFVLVAIGRQHVLPIINAAVLSINLALNFLLIGRYGPAGSAYALLISEICAFAMIMAAMHRFILLPARPQHLHRAVDA
ncbi:MAG: flippase [Candidatus Omnitrophota bacterium]